MLEHRVSKSQLKWLTNQIASWQTQEFLSADQAERVLKLYPTQSELTHRYRSAFFLCLTGAAVLLIGMGMMLLVGYNWNAMSGAFKLVLLFGALIGLQSLALILRFHRNSKVWSEICFLTGGLLFGVGIFLVAQIFHVNAHYPAGIYWWALGILPFALCLDTLLLHILLVSLLAIWCEMEIVNFSNAGIWFFGRWPHLHNGAFSLPFLTIPGFLWAYRKESLACAGLYTSLLSWWCILQPIGLRSHWEGVFFIGMVGGLMLIISESLNRGDVFAGPFRIFGFLLAGGSLFLVSNCHFLRGIQTNLKLSQLVPIATIGVLAVGIMIANISLRISRAQSRASCMLEIREIFRRQLLPVSLMLVMTFLLILSMVIQEPWLTTIASNISVLWLAGWIVAMGIREDRALFITAGVLYFLLWAVIRYIDLFGGFGGMLGAALIFMLCGGVLLGTALYWRKRGRTKHE